MLSFLVVSACLVAQVAVGSNLSAGLQMAMVFSVRCSQDTRPGASWRRGNDLYSSELPTHISGDSEWPPDCASPLVLARGTWRAIWRESRICGVRVFWERWSTLRRSLSWRILQPSEGMPSVSGWSVPQARAGMITTRRRVEATRYSRTPQSRAWCGHRSLRSATIQYVRERLPQDRAQRAQPVRGARRTQARRPVPFQAHRHQWLSAPQTRKMDCRQ
jgi:hypothetical protein